MRLTEGMTIMMHLSEDQRTLLLIFRHVRMPTKEAAAAMTLIEKYGLEREMVEWLLQNAKANSNQILTALLLIVKRIQERLL